MSATTGPKIGLQYAWSLGESGWNTGMDANLRLLERVGVQPTVKDKDLATPPGSPANGDSYIVAASPTGAWVGHATHIAVWSTEGTPAWAFYTPTEGWRVDVVDEDLEYRFAGSAWAAVSGGVTDHGALTGLGDDDHAQYHTDARGDARYDALGAAAAAQTAAQSYADTLVVGLIDDRGNYDASGNAFPSSGGSGAAGAILKGDLWTISVAGTLGGHPVTAGDLLRALVDTPGATDANWAITENNIGFVAENASNKDTDGTLAANSDTKYASQKAVKTYADTKQAALALAANQFYARDSVGAAANKTISDNALTFLAAANYAAMRTALGVPGLGDANTWTAQNTFAAGTITTSQPLTITQTWNAAGVTFNGIFANITDTASAAASLLMDLQVGGVSQFKVTKAGAATITGALTAGNNFFGTNGGAIFSWAGNMTVATGLSGLNSSGIVGFKTSVVAESATRSLTNRTQYAVTNEGATSKPVLTLISAATGDNYTFVVQDADGIRIAANTGDTIRVIDKVTAAAGYIESTTIGSVVTLVAINATEWIATSIQGVWTDGTFTYDDTGLTTP